MTRVALRSTSQQYLLNPQILLINGNPDAVRSFSRVLTMVAPLARVSEAKDAGTALRMLVSDSYQLVILDLNTPGLNGLTLLSQVASRSPKAIRIVQSSQIDALGRELVQRWAHKILDGPTSTHEILTTIRWALGELAKTSGTRLAL
jgi:DNA-binding NtrC family response regulator